MKGAIHFFGRLTVAFLLLVILAVVISFVTLVLLIASGKQNAGIMVGAIILPMVVASAPAVFVASLTSDDKKKTRFWAAIKSIIVVSAIYALWSYFVGPWVGVNIFSGSNNAFQMAVAVDGFVATVLTFLSGIFAAHWLPSLRSSAAGVPPKSVKNFEMLMFLYLGIFLLSAVLNYDYAVEQTSASASNTILSGMMGGPFVIATFASSFLIIFYLTVRVSRAGSKAMRAVMLGFYLIGIIYSVPGMVNMLKTNQMSAMLSFVLLLIQGYALYLVFSPESNKWFEGDAKPKVLNASRL